MTKKKKRHKNNIWKQTTNRRSSVLIFSLISYGCFLLLSFLLLLLLFPLSFRRITTNNNKQHGIGQNLNLGPSSKGNDEYGDKTCKFKMMQSFVDDQNVMDLIIYFFFLHFMDRLEQRRFFGIIIYLCFVF